MGHLLWVLALAAPSRAHAGEKASEPSASQPDGDRSSPEERAALDAARADLDRLLATLSDESSEPPAPSPESMQGSVAPVPAPVPVPARTLSEATGPVEPGPGKNWLEGLQLPDIPIRWHDALLQLLTHYRSDPRGRAHIRAWLERAGRYDAMIGHKLAARGLPRDLAFVAMVESGFDPMARSDAGAVGIWQFVAGTATEYGLQQSPWLDERRSPELATDAAVRYLETLYAKLGSWPMSLAAFNMGYGALVRAVVKYNTNDFWLLSRLEAGLPYETVVYVAKVMACAIVSRNLARFGLADLQKEPTLELTSLRVPGGASLSSIAAAAEVSVLELAAWNPELLRDRVPPDVPHWNLQVPKQVSARAAAHAAKLHAAARPARHTLRFGERLADVAAIYGTSERRLRAFNGLDEDRKVVAGAVLNVPDVPPQVHSDEGAAVVAVPRASFAYPSRRHIFYRVREGDRAEEIAEFFKVELRELRLWNAISTDVALHRGMILQLYVPPEVDLERAVYLDPERARVLTVGSQEFLDYHEGLRDRVRIRYRVKPGDTLSELAQRFELSEGSIGRINGFSSDHKLDAGTEIVLYVKVREPTPKSDSRPVARR
jgi:membrane-bound lytic murein transglycosylase D